MAGRAFGEMGFEHITILLPPTRTKLAAIKRLRFEREGEAEVGGESFMRFVLTRERYRKLVQDPAARFSS